MKLAKDLKRHFQRLEKTGNDDFQLILIGGAKAYATYELHHLLRRLRIDSMRLRKYRKQLLWLAGGIPALLGIATFAVAFNQLALTYLCLALCAMFIVVLALGQHNLDQHYASIKSAEELRYLIHQELARRRSDAEIH